MPKRNPKTFVSAKGKERRDSGSPSGVRCPLCHMVFESDVGIRRHTIRYHEMLWHKNGPPTRLSPVELSDWKQKVKLQQMNSKQRAAWRTKMDRENLEELENAFLELAQTPVAAASEGPSGDAINLRSVTSQPPVPDDLVGEVAELDLMEGVLPPPPQLPVFPLAPAPIAEEGWNVLTDFFCPEDGDIATEFNWRMPPRRDNATLEIRKVFVIPDVGTDQGAQTEELARHFFYIFFIKIFKGLHTAIMATRCSPNAIGIQVSPLCSGLMPPPIGFSYGEIAAKVLEWDRLTTGGVVERLLVESGGTFSETDRRQLQVIVASCIIGMRTFARGLQDRYEQMISSPMAGSAQALVSGLVDEAALRSFNDVETVFQLPLHSRIEEDSVGWSSSGE